MSFFADSAASYTWSAMLVSKEKNEMQLNEIEDQNLGWLQTSMCVILV
jgi:hypothetical protein